MDEGETHQGRSTEELLQEQARDISDQERDPEKIRGAADGGYMQGRGQMYNWHDRKWVRDENGKILTGKRTCDWEPKEKRA